MDIITFFDGTFYQNSKVLKLEKILEMSPEELIAKKAQFTPKAFAQALLFLAEDMAETLYDDPEPEEIEEEEEEEGEPWNEPEMLEVSLDKIELPKDALILTEEQAKFGKDKPIKLASQGDNYMVVVGVAAIQWLRYQKNKTVTAQVFDCIDAALAS